MSALDPTSWPYRCGELEHHVRALIRQGELLAAKHGERLDPDCGLGLAVRMAKRTLDAHTAISRQRGAA